jgi:hypothetical protein
MNRKPPLHLKPQMPHRSNLLQQAVELPKHLHPGAPLSLDKAATTRASSRSTREPFQTASASATSKSSRSSPSSHAVPWVSAKRASAGATPCSSNHRRPTASCSRPGPESSAGTRAFPRSWVAAPQRARPPGPPVVPATGPERRPTAPPRRHGPAAGGPPAAAGPQRGRAAAGRLRGGERVRGVRKTTRAPLDDVRALQIHSDRQSRCLEVNRRSWENQNEVL